MDAKNAEVLFYKINHSGRSQLIRRHVDEFNIEFIKEEKTRKGKEIKYLPLQVTKNGYRLKSVKRTDIKVGQGPLDFFYDYKNDIYYRLSLVDTIIDITHATFTDC